MSHADLAAAAAYTTPPLWRILTKTGYFVGLSGAIGSTVTYAVSVRPGLRAPESEADDVAALQRRTSVYLAWSGLVLLVAGYFQLAGRVARAGKGMAFGDALAPGRISDFLNAPAAKGAWVAQGTIHIAQNIVLVLAAVTLISLFTAAGRRNLNAVALTALPLSLAITLVGAIPATAPKNTEKWLDLAFGQAHIISGTVWIGGLALLLALTGTRRHLSANAGLLWADIW
ncbi:hypothetical protein AB0I68_37300 [Streptomyces sp. NPDC050448]|uniref:hypothetical protein n=1 Tax=Streptomyces sp. NPDC050448 TaxID=3155404 RepID=UPI003448B324